MEGVQQLWPGVGLVNPFCLIFFLKFSQLKFPFQCILDLMWGLFNE